MDKGKPWPVLYPVTENALFGTHDFLKPEISYPVNLSVHALWVMVLICHWSSECGHLSDTRESERLVFFPS